MWKPSVIPFLRVKRYIATISWYIAYLKSLDAKSFRLRRQVNHS